MGISQLIIQCIYHSREGVMHTLSMQRTHLSHVKYFQCECV